MQMAVSPRERLCLQLTGEASASRRPASHLDPWRLLVGTSVGTGIFPEGISVLVLQKNQLLLGERALCPDYLYRRLQFC